MSNPAFRPLVLIGSVLVLSSCSGEDVEQTAQGTAGQPETDDQMVVLENNNGGVQSQAGQNLNLPAGFPDDVAHYPDLNIYGANTISTMGYALTALAEASPDDIAAYYSREMSVLGWSETADEASGPGRLLRFEKGTRTFSVNLIPNGASTSVSITAMN